MFVSATNLYGNTILKKYVNPKKDEKYYNTQPIHLINAAKSLQSFKDIVVKKADKGGKLVLWDRNECPRRTRSTQQQYIFGH
ncbi:hypothetical protein GJ496_003205 [Pomphorhynchus laevis]|nr:hypothetical protein GJ496_002574 [Pomphorhynchus laevis]KAI0978851.1 hypothetical protein GJ496_001871 [Pomphorhynchus laevis]KAI0984579.1 hypothetical protein GJ496_009252 [Pomphorhynchus laevis]KAI0988595.1 hypothetical protein GJ496_003205 [Pomphorhynchus laevis]